MIDSLNGFLQAMPGEQFLALHLHELLTYLNNRGVVTLMVLAQMGLVGSAMRTPIDVSYLAGNILILRYSGSRAVDVRVTGNESKVVLTVKDYGMGVPREVLDRFWKTGNVGVGLAGIRERLKELGGFLEIESNLDGTLLRATIPVQVHRQQGATENVLAHDLARRASPTD